MPAMAMHVYIDSVQSVCKVFVKCLYQNTHHPVPAVAWRPQHPPELFINEIREDGFVRWRGVCVVFLLVSFTSSIDAISVP